ncbi:MAG: nitroreductase family protein [Deltaproteobacteria bacterium]|nr:MAG: nitroreductase family protein [Deltaproteobacteria bacterium]
MLLEKYRKITRPEGQTCTPVVDPEKCSGCGLCYEICAFGSYLWEYDRPKPEYAMELGGKMQCTCVGCRACIAVCPQDAITIKGSMVFTAGKYRSVYPEREISYPTPLGPGKDYESIFQDLTEVERVIYRRRSNRIFKKDKPPREMIHRLLETARFAPTAGNCQPVRFIVIDDRKLIDELRDGISPNLKMLTKLHRKRGLLGRFLIWLYGLSKPGTVDIRPVYALKAFLLDTEKKLDLFQHAPVLILVLGDTRGVGKYQLDCGIASQNIVLTAHSLGLGTCYIGFIEALNMNARLKKKLGIEYPYSVVTSIALGYPRAKQDAVVEREITPVQWLGEADKEGA